MANELNIRCVYELEETTGSAALAIRLASLKRGETAN